MMPSISGMLAVRRNSINELLGVGIFAALVACFAPNAWADCSCSGTTCTPDTLSQSDVQACLDDASDGYTIILPPGSSPSWSGIIEVTHEDMTIQGAGYDDTTINGGGFWLSNRDIHDANGTRIKGVHFNGSRIYINCCVSPGAEYQSQYYSASGRVSGWVISECRFDVTSNAIKIATGSTGLIANNYFNIAGGSYVEVIYVFGLNPGTVEWEADAGLGEAGTHVFIEDNYFFGAKAAATFNHAVTGRIGGSYVVRCNRSSGGYTVWDTHGFGYGTTRGMRSWEIYGNLITNNSQNNAMSLRGGTGRVFANRWDTCTGDCLSDSICGGGDGAAIRMYEARTISVSDNNSYPSSTSDCSAGFGSNCGQFNPDCCNQYEQYPCCDQVGWGRDGSGEDNNQFPEPVYFWDNTTIGGTSVGVCSIEQNFIQLNREYYKQDVAPAGYIPYTYPHPDRGLSPTYTCLTGDNSEADTGITFRPSAPSNLARGCGCGQRQDFDGWPVLALIGFCVWLNLRQRYNRRTF